MNNDQLSPLNQWIDRIVFAVSLVLVLACAGGLLLADWPGAPHSPKLVATVVAQQRVGQNLVVRFKVENQGTQSVDEVKVEIELSGSEDTVDTTITHVPQGMSQAGVAVFTDAPAGAQPRAHVVSYLLP